MCNQSIIDTMLDLANLQDCFEQVLLAYKEHRWDDLLTRLAPQPRTTISKALKEHGAQYIIGTGEIPNIWQYQHAVPVSADKFHVYALMANQNHGDDMQHFRFVFTRSKNPDTTTPRWLFSKSGGLSEAEYGKGIYACLQWAPEHYYDPEERE